eukprot:397812-Pleurochrysis_carterae.AAC.1
MRDCMRLHADGDPIKHTNWSIGSPGTKHARAEKKRKKAAEKVAETAAAAPRAAAEAADDEPPATHARVTALRPRRGSATGGASSAA